MAIRGRVVFLGWGDRRANRIPGSTPWLPAAVHPLHDTPRSLTPRADDVLLSAGASRGDRARRRTDVRHCRGRHENDLGRACQPAGITLIKRVDGTQSTGPSAAARSSGHSPSRASRPPSPRPRCSNASDPTALVICEVTIKTVTCGVLEVSIALPICHFLLVINVQTRTPSRWRWQRVLVAGRSLARLPLACGYPRVWGRTPSPRHRRQVVMYRL
jgi:hypothetical protein